MCVKNTHFKCLKCYYRDLRVKVTHLFLECNLGFLLLIEIIFEGKSSLLKSHIKTHQYDKYVTKTCVIHLIHNNNVIYLFFPY